MLALVDGILLIGHGSSDEEGVAQFEEMVNRVAKQLTPSVPIYGAFLEFADPRIIDMVSQLASKGIRRIAAIPVMLLDAGHKMHDIPHELAEARQIHPEVDIQYGDHLGFDPDLMTLLMRRAEPFQPDGGTGILLVGRGSSDPVANAHFYQMSRMFWEATQYTWVENAFIGITQPDLPAGLERMYRLGIQRIIVVPYFLFTGKLFKKIEQTSYNFARDHRNLAVHVTQYFGLEDTIVDLVIRRIGEVLKEKHTAYDVDWMRTWASHRYPLSSHHGEHAHSHQDHRRENNS